ncbi:TetR/AcrR family transcriptional regulator [Lentzea flava]|uniref:TetR family transcriptional regulator n=1 Tax=Lentzea flava TaxID=103732 RepID=A0ABQ2V6H6_9PSEU|nr:TetR/AcrR family transcriptional regulator [Lentzea flava]MCP2203110.1 transcriptional regulator, TetR family [Lentzea flava]GGU66119.1 TetR family transcriptional regulator [Lentzea flava]
MVRNEARRTALLDAAIDVLAEEGARGLTYRAVDAKAGVPAGTASNYFANRDDLMSEVAIRVTQRLVPSDESIAQSLALPRDKSLTIRFMHDIVRRADADKACYLALMELRLEATRRPDLRTALTRTMADNLEFNISFNEESKLPGDRMTVILLYFAMTGFIYERLTLPDITEPMDLDEFIEVLVDRAIGSD